MARRPITLLLVEDDDELRTLLSEALRRQGYAVETAASGQEALGRWAAEKPDLVLLDVNLPDQSGFEVCQRIREEADTPVILLTGRGEEADIVHGLQVGADDYVTKPFSARQLTARMHAVLRRYQSGTRRTEGEVRAGNLVLDVQTHAVRVVPDVAGAGRSGEEGEGQERDEGRLVTLTPTELRILYLLMMNEGRVVPYSRLVEYALREPGEHSTMVLQTHVTHLRRKLGLRANEPGGVQSVAGVGYSFTRSTGRERQRPLAPPT